ncbi:hypothetical protein ASF61_17760 [Duganella sp. Leaf126]|uniref:hypothetical protein n=1 Tax=Duganella sp. Leaf126 TaxID=1736266 RepID=UPI0006FF9B29|nr:hypothetical protein [Duganella sp. Leaf126]KQQ31069.1 hypothetical protein ASF61_17760 [Duganella sp. Leaf126]
MNRYDTPSTLHIARKLLSLLGKIEVTDDDDNVLYEASAQWSWFIRPWSITQNGRQVATVRRKCLSFAPTWYVQTSDENFALRARLWSWRRQVMVVGGRFDGAVLRGGLWDRGFELSWQDRLIARAQARIMTLRTRHSIALLDPSPQAALLTVILMTTLVEQKSDERKLGAAADSSPHGFTSAP